MAQLRSKSHRNVNAQWKNNILKRRSRLPLGRSTVGLSVTRKAESLQLVALKRSKAWALITILTVKSSQPKLTLESGHLLLFNHPISLNRLDLIRALGVFLRKLLSNTMPLTHAINHTVPLSIQFKLSKTVSSPSKIMLKALRLNT